jgi:hypothetical protein
MTVVQRRYGHRQQLQGIDVNGQPAASGDPQQPNGHCHEPRVIPFVAIAVAVVVVVVAGPPYCIVAALNDARFSWRSDHIDI